MHVAGLATSSRFLLPHPLPLIAYAKKRGEGGVGEKLLPLFYNSSITIIACSQTHLIYPLRQIAVIKYTDVSVVPFSHSPSAISTTDTWKTRLQAVMSAGFRSKVQQPTSRGGKKEEAGKSRKRKKYRTITEEKETLIPTHPATATLRKAVDNSRIYLLRIGFVSRQWSGQ